MNDPCTDLVLIGLKAVASRGGEYGPLYDRGVLSVIAQVEASGVYEPSRLLPLVGLHRDPETARVCLTASELAGLEHELSVRGWSLAQGAEFAAGVRAAQQALVRYRSPG